MNVRYVRIDVHKKRAEVYILRPAGQIDPRAVRSWFDENSPTWNALPVVAEGDVGVPIATGFFRPLIVLPHGLCERISRRQLQDVLTHEFAHAQRRDGLVLWIEGLTQALYWPLPPVHVLLRDLAQAREEACDNYVLVDSLDRIDYGETLLRLAEICMPRSRMMLTADMFSRGEELAARMLGIVDPSRNTSTRARPWTVALVCAALLAAGVPLCCLSIVAAETTSTDGNDEHELEALLAGLDETSAAIRNLSVTTNHENHV